MIGFRNASSGTYLTQLFRWKLTPGYLVPVIFIVYFIGISRIGHALLRISWSVSAFLLVVYNKNFLQGVQSEYSLSFVLSVLISFTICLFYMADIYARSDRNKRRWRSQAEEDPLTRAAVPGKNRTRYRHLGGS